MKVECRVDGYHPATGLDLVAGEMEVTEEHAVALEAAGLAVPKKTPRAAKPEKKEE